MKLFVYKHCVVLSVVWAVIIFILCSTPGQYIPSASWLELLSFDKWVHASVFFILCALLIVVAIRKNQNRSIILLYFLLCVAYGGLLEIMQAKLFSNRSADWQDFAANTFGCMVALLLFKKFKAGYLAFS